MMVPVLSESLCPLLAIVHPVLNQFPGSQLRLPQLPHLPQPRAEAARSVPPLPGLVGSCPTESLQGDLLLTPSARVPRLPTCRGCPEFIPHLV